MLFLCYAHYCPHCQGLPEGLKRYSEGLGNRNDIYISMVDCAESSCARFQIVGTPTIYLIIGNKPRYWPTTSERGPEGWDRWINETMAPSIKEISTDSDFDAALEETSEGGSLFYYKTDQKDDPFIETLKYYSRFFKHYKDIFICRHNEHFKKELIAYTSPYCKFVYSGSFTSNKEIEKFLNTHKFGVLHRFDNDEIREVGNGKEFGAVLVSSEDISDSQKESLQIISKEYCNAQYGWYKTDDSSNTFLRSFGAGYDDIPFLLGVGAYSGQKLIYKGKVRNAWKSGFLDLIQKKATGNIFRSFLSKFTAEDFLALLIIALIILIGILIYVVLDLCRMQRIINSHSRKVEV